MPADLHIHTIDSDGTETIDDRVNDAEQKNLDYIAITDHDKIPKELDSRYEERDNIGIITGAEIKCEIDDNRIEILGYFLDPSDEQLQDLMEENTRLREERMREFVENINELFEYDLEYSEVESFANGPIGRPHLAKALVENDLVSDENEAFEEYIGSDCPAYVKTPKVDAETVIETIKNNGGATSLAHPGRDLTEENAEELVSKLSNLGIDGIEVFYTYQDKRERDSFNINFGSEYSNQLAEQFNLLKTGGTDCHGKDSGKYYLGDVTIDNSIVNELESISRKRRA